MEKAVKSSGIHERDLTIRARHRGGFIATCGRKEGLCIGVTADTEHEAREALELALRRAKELRDEELSQQPLN